MKRKIIIFVSIVSIFVFSFPLFTFAAVPDGYDRLKSFTYNSDCIAYTARFIPNMPLTYGQGYWSWAQGTWSSSALGARLLNYFVNFSNSKMALFLYNPNYYMTAQENVHYYFTTSVMIGINNDFELSDSIVDDIVGGLRLYFGAHAYPTDSGNIVVDWYSYRYEAGYIRVNFQGYFFSDNSDVDIKYLGIELNAEFRETDTLEVYFNTFTVFSSVSDDFIYVNGEYVNKYNELDLIINQLENNIMVSMKNQFSDFTQIMPSSNNTPFLEFGNEFKAMNSMVNNVLRIPKLEALVKFSISIGLIGLLFGFFPIFLKRGKDE